MGLLVFPAPSAGVNRFTQIFTSSGTFVAPSTCNSVEITLVGGGGGAGGILTPASNNESRASGGGGGGQVLKRVFSVTPGASYTVTIGNGGAGGSGAASGAVGGDSSFGSLATALGGGGGQGANQNNPTPPNTRATSGGTWAAGNLKWSGAGGGAGGDATWFTVNVANNSYRIDTNSVQTVSNNLNPIAGGRGSQAGDVNAHTAGLPLDGFGAGGAGAMSGFSTSYPDNNRGNMTSFNGIAPIVQQSGAGTTINGVSAAANTGHGGNGGAACSGGTQLTSTGGNGGSGICIVTYFA